MINSKNMLKYKPNIGFEVLKTSDFIFLISHSSFLKVYLKVVLTRLLLDINYDSWLCNLEQVAFLFLLFLTYLWSS